MQARIRIQDYFSNHKRDIIAFCHKSSISESVHTIIPEHQSKLTQQPRRTSKRGQVLLLGIYLDHRLRHRQHPSIPV